MLMATRGDDETPQLEDGCRTSFRPRLPHAVHLVPKVTDAVTKASNLRAFAGYYLRGAVSADTQNRLEAALATSSPMRLA